MQKYKIDSDKVKKRLKFEYKGEKVKKRNYRDTGMMRDLYKQKKSEGLRFKAQFYVNKRSDILREMEEVKRVRNGKWMKKKQKRFLERKKEREIEDGRDLIQCRTEKNFMKSTRLEKMLRKGLVGYLYN